MLVYNLMLQDNLEQLVQVNDHILGLMICLRDPLIILVLGGEVLFLLTNF